MNFKQCLNESHYMTPTIEATLKPNTPCKRFTYRLLGSMRNFCFSKFCFIVNLGLCSALWCPLNEAVLAQTSNPSAPQDSPSTQTVEAKTIAVPSSSGESQHGAKSSSKKEAPAKSSKLSPRPKVVRFEVLVKPNKLKRLARKSPSNKTYPTNG